MSAAPKKRKFGNDDETPESTSGHGRGCLAHGCQLARVFSNSTGGEFHCWAHDRLREPSQWPFLTQGITENLWLFRVAERVACMPLFDLDRKQSEIGSYLAGRGRPELARLKNTGEWSDRCPDEPRSYWVGRLRNAAFKAAMEYVNRNWSRAAVGRFPSPALAKAEAMRQEL